MKKLLTLSILLFSTLSFATFWGPVTVNKVERKTVTADIELTSFNHIVLDTDVNPESVRQMKMDLAAIAKKRGNAKYPLYIVLKSPGGSIYHGLSFIAYAKQFKNVHTIGIFAASMAHGFIQHLPGTRYIVENTQLMAHRARGSFSGQFEDGEVEEQLRHWKNVVRHMETVNARRIGISLKEYKARVKDEWWCFGKECVEVGHADRLASVSCSEELLKVVEKVVQVKFGGIPLGTRVIKKMACPL